MNMRFCIAHDKMSRGAVAQTPLDVNTIGIVVHNCTHAVDFRRRMQNDCAAVGNGRSSNFRMYPPTQGRNTEDWNILTGDPLMTVDSIPVNSVTQQTQVFSTWNDYTVSTGKFASYPGRTAFEKCLNYTMDHTRFAGIAIKDSPFQDKMKNQDPDAPVGQLFGISQVRYTHESSVCQPGRMLIALPPQTQNLYTIQHEGENTTRMYTLVKTLDMTDIFPTKASFRDYFRLDEIEDLKMFDVNLPTPQLPMCDGIFALQQATIIATVVALKAKFPNALSDVSPEVVAGLYESGQFRHLHTITNAEQAAKCGRSDLIDVPLHRAILAMTFTENVDHMPPGLTPEGATVLINGVTDFFSDSMFQIKTVFSMCIGKSLTYAPQGGWVKVQLFGSTL